MRLRPSGDVRSWTAAHREPLIHIAAGLVAGIVLLTSAFAGQPQPINRLHWKGGPGKGGGQGGQPAAAPAAPGSSPTTDSNGQSPGPTNPATGKPRTPKTTTPPAPPPSGTSGRSGKPTDYLAQIPRFPPAPQPEKITLPDGPLAPYLSRIPTTQKVAFITMDDGWSKSTQGIELVKAAKVPVTLFLTMNAIRSNPGYFRQFQSSGAVIEAHTITHIDLKGKSYEFQKHEICGSADQLAALYGRRPVLFRPPFGDKDEVTLQATRDCGMKAAFFWKETVDNGIVRFQEGRTVQPGDIILMHFRPVFADDFIATLQAIHAAGLTPALLEEYIP
jgi:peptidoglycan/xylan/chitin deacetylase (PgdA/CDA1 family)